MTSRNKRRYTPSAGGMGVRVLVVILAFGCLSYAQETQPILQITSPASGSVVNPGQTISVIVKSLIAVPLTQVFVVGEGPIGFSDVVKSAPYQFSIAVPEKITNRRYLLTALATTAAGEVVQSDPIAVDVERADSPTKMTAEPPKLIFDSQGDQIPIRVSGSFSDGSYLDITESSRVVYQSSNPKVAIVDGAGMVTAVGTGSASVTATYSQGAQSVQAVIPVAAAIPVLALSPTALTFGNRAVGTTSAGQVLTLTNGSNGPLKILGITATGDYSETDNCISSSPISSRGTCNINVLFSPTVNGTRGGSLSVTNTFSSVPSGVTLTGAGVGPAIGLAPDGLTFGLEEVTTTSARQTVVLTNNGGSALAVSKIFVVGDFVESNNCVPMSPLAPSATCSINVTFNPTAAGIRGGILSVTDDVLGSPHTVSLTGAGTDFSLGTSSGGSTSETITAGQPATFNLQVNPLGGFTGSVSVVCTGAPAGASCVPSPNPLTLSGTSAAGFTLNVTTMARALLPPAPVSDPRVGFPQPSLLKTWFLMFLALSMVGAASLRPRRSRLWGSTVFLVCLATLLTACVSGGNGGGSGGNGANGTPPGTYTLTVTGASGGLTRTTTVSLTVR